MGLIVSHLLLWLAAPRYAKPSTISITAITVYSLLWILAGPLFISDGSLVNGILISTVIIILTSICPMIVLQPPWLRRLTTALIYGSIGACLVVQTPSLAVQAPVVLPAESRLQELRIDVKETVQNWMLNSNSTSGSGSIYHGYGENNIDDSSDAIKLWIEQT